MTAYRLYCLDGANHINDAPEWIEARSDDEAIVLARAKKLLVKCELWDGSRCVAAIEPRLAG